MTWFDDLPAAYRHFLIAVILTPLAGFVGALALAVVQAKGISIPTDTFSNALNAAAVTAASGLLGWITLVLTPITRQYGVGAIQDGPDALVHPDAPLVAPEDASTHPDLLPPPPTATGGQDG